MKVKSTIVTMQEGSPVMENALGCKWTPHQEGEKWGLGTFFYKGQQLGEAIPWFLTEETTRDKYRASAFSVLENTSQQGRIRFSGTDGKLRFTATITLTADSCAYRIDFTFDPVHPIYHPLYLSIPYESGASRFVKHPYETTILSDDLHRWSVQPDSARAPLLFGNLQWNGKDYFVGIGYALDDDFTQGRLEYDPGTSPDSALQIYTPFKGMARPVDLQCVTRMELARSPYIGGFDSPHQMHVVLSTAGSQFDCIRGYIAQCRYDDSVEFNYSIQQSVQALFSLYKQSPGYVPGKGYHQLIRFDTGDFDTTVPHGWYSKYIVTGPQLLLAHQLYKWWKQNKNEAWARERAFEMADFTLSIQESCGAFTNWDTDMEGSSIMHPNDVEGTEFNQCIYSISDISLGITHWLALYNDVLDTEGIERDDWKDGLIRATAFMSSLVGEDGELGRNYDLEGHYDKLTSGVTEALQAFTCVARQFGILEVEAARDRLEQWVYEHYIRVNNWCNGSVDGGAWQGAGWPPPHNNDLMGVFNYAAYCSDQYRFTGKDDYLQKAKDAVAYIWASVMPVETKGFTLPTRTLVREQDFYSIYGVLIRGNDSIECLPYLSKITQDPFFMKFYQLILQVQISYQAFDQRFAGFHIGLECDKTGREPINKFAEGNNGYITRFAPQFLKSVTDEMAYRYVGGRNWGLGADYHLTFDLDVEEQGAYVLCASTMVRNIVWDEKKKRLAVFLYDLQQTEGVLEVELPNSLAGGTMEIELDGEQALAIEISERGNVLNIPYKHKKPSLLIQIMF